MTTATLNRWFDLRLRPRLHLVRGDWHAFQVCGAIGWAAGISLALMLTRALGVDVRVTAILALCAIATFVLLGLLDRAVAGEENIVYYHHEIAVALVSATLLWLLREPVLPYLDAVFMGLGLFLACGRVGCLMVGCCHGRPHAWGVRYTQAHAAAGFARALVGVRLFPIQLIEALFVAGTVALGSLLVLRHAAPGTALASYSIVYGLGRFGFEFLRGDTSRPYVGRFSEAQWTTLALMSATSIAELAGLLPLAGWHVAATIGVATAMGCGTLADRPARALYTASHVMQVAEAVGVSRARAVAQGEILMCETALGVRISVSRILEGDRDVEVVAFSFAQRVTRPRAAAARLARLIARLVPARAEWDFFEGAGGVFHVVVPGDRRAHAV